MLPMASISLVRRDGLGWAGGEMQRPLVFTAHHATVTLSEEGTVATNEVVNWRSAVCGGHEMTAGVHCAHFRIWGLCHRAIRLHSGGVDLSLR